MYEELRSSRLFLFFKNKEFITLWFKSTYYVVLNAMREKNIVYVHTPQLLNNWRIYWLYVLTKRKRAFTANCLNNYEDVVRGGSWIIGSRLFIILCFFLQIIHYSFQIFPWYSLFIYLVFVSVFLSQIFYNAILYIVYQKFTFKYTFNLIFSKYHSIFSINVVKIIWCYPLRLIGRPCNY